jgi:alkanesulfonate monooxygenase SsuD/methylene tetrahydromethanopterin reductase-like flavin-dependent oxidoreductase (luciferase family)
MKYAIQFPNFGSFIKDISDVVKLAQEAEKVGWDGFFLSDQLIFVRYPNMALLDPWITLTAIAVKTKSIKIGTMVTPIPRRRPWVLARECVTLDHLSNGRLILGVGIGDPRHEFTTFGEDWNLKTRAQKLDEGLDIILGLWSGEDFKYKGDHNLIRKVKFLPKPVNNHIPIWVGGMWPNKKPFQRAAKFDGTCPSHINYPKQLSPDDIIQMLDYIKQFRTNSKHFDVYIVGDTPGNPEEGAKLIEPYEKAGVTWWGERIDEYKFSNSSEKIRERILQGPPKI